MKKRRNVIVAFVICALLCLGIGYAALTDTLTVNGTVSGDASADVHDPSVFDVNFTAAEFTTSRTAITVTDGFTGVSNVDDAVTLTIGGLSAKGDTVTIEYTLTVAKCPDACNLALTAPEDTTALDFNCTLSKLNGLVQGDSVTLTVVVTAKTTLVKDATLSESFTVKVNATNVAAQ